MAGILVDILFVIILFIYFIYLFYLLFYLFIIYFSHNSLFAHISSHIYDVHFQEVSSLYLFRVDTPMGTHFCQYLFLIDCHSQSNLGFYPLHALLYQERFVFTLFIIKFEQIVMASKIK